MLDVMRAMVAFALVTGCGFAPAAVTAGVDAHLGDAIDAPIDTPSNLFCFGSHPIDRVCLATLPGGSMTFNGIDMNTANDPGGVALVASEMPIAGTLTAGGAAGWGTINNGNVGGNGGGAGGLIVLDATTSLNGSGFILAQGGGGGEGSGGNRGFDGHDGYDLM